MNEVTIWDNRPREMWVWDNDSAVKKRKKVVYLCDFVGLTYPVVALSEGLTEGSICLSVFKHCAEIEESKTRRMTNQEFAWWLREKPTREYKRNYGSLVSFEYSYIEEKADGPVSVDILIREDGGEWHEPLVEVEE